MLDWAVILTLIGSSMAVIGFVYGFLQNFKSDINRHMDRVEKRLDSDIKTIGNKMDSDIRKLENDIKSLSIKIDADTRAQSARSDQISARSDQLYQIIIDLLKSQNPKTNP